MSIIYVQHIKHAKLLIVPFPVTMNKSTTLFELIHTDIWGPTSFLSHTGHFYYVHVLDDSSKYSWFYVMNSCSDILRVF